MRTAPFPILKERRYNVAKMKLSHPRAGGLVVGMSQDGKELYCTTEDTHTLILGTTRSGKSRGLVLPSICLMALAGESMINVDPKAELYLYTYPFLERLGYEVITIDFCSPLKSNRYNFLQPVIDAVNQGDKALAVTRARDIAAMLVPNDRTERIWLDGQRSILTMGILAVVVDNMGHPEYQNMANAYQFIAKMCSPVGPRGELPIVRYLSELPADHPAQIAMSISKIAPDKMRGSFYTSALVSLELFTDSAIHSMTAYTDFDCYTTGKNKRAIFIILPDYKSTYYSLASLFVYQQYQILAEVSAASGNRLPRRVNFLCDELGNFTKITDFDKMITVGAGKGCRFHLFLQDFNQLDERYGDKVGKTIRSNADTWVYLRSKDAATLKELSESLGRYTVKSPSLSGSTGGNMSASYNLTGRELLTVSELEKISRPYQLVKTGADPVIMYAPDISKTIFNRMLGLGDEAHNTALILQRGARRPEHPIETKYWGIWELYERLLKIAQ